MKLYKKFLNKHGIDLDNESTEKLFTVLYRVGLVPSRYKSDHDIYVKFTNAVKLLKSNHKAVAFMRIKFNISKQKLRRVRLRIDSLE